MFVINEDNSHFFATRKPSQMTREALLAFVDQYANSAVTHLFLCPNAMRASFRSRTREAIWDVTGKETMPGANDPRGRWPHNARLLHERGLDPYAVWIDRCREKGLSPWLSMRMNDIHGVNELDSFMHSSFWRSHPEYWRVPSGSAAPWQNRALNYAEPEVRKYEMAFVRELLERYNPDGIELDWMRFGWHFPPGKARENARFLTEFVREARRLTETWGRKRGHRIALGVRVPAHPDAARGLGMDAVEWVREGLVDLIVPCPFWTTSDFDIPVELWKERLAKLSAAEHVRVAPGLEFNARPWPGAAAVANTLGSVAGFAAAAWHRGADGIYLFNWMDSGTRPVASSVYRTLIERGVARAVVEHAPRRVPVCFRDTVPPNFPNNVRLPVDAVQGGEFRIYFGPKPTAGKAWIIAGLSGRNGVEKARFQAAINGRTAAPAPDLDSCAGIGGGARRAVRFECPPSAFRDGYNTVSLRQETNSVPPQRIVWVELRTGP
ncbi:MAG: hypothetical protein GXP31_04370 [Kiritimatiellaeota bacterium]|nr:hypothetical protein [Kiritimatiellota bacterium]